MLLCASLLVGACERERREFRRDPVVASDEDKITMSSISPGGGQPAAQSSARAKEFENNAYHVSQGKKYYTWFNCNGCHSNGGGGSGPPLMDDTWIYGGSMENIVRTIKEGRPNGMPSFRDRIPDDQIWELAAYVRSMGRAIPQDVAPGRNDDMHPRPAENRQPYVTPIPGGSTPPSGLAPQ